MRNGFMRSGDGPLRILLVLSGFAVQACRMADAPSDADVGVPIQTHRKTYPLQGPELVIEATYTNRTGRTVYPARCGFNPPSFRLEKRIGREWVSAYTQFCELVSVPAPFKVRPGETYTDTIRLVTSRDPKVVGFDVEEIPGRYRLVYRIYDAWDARRGVPAGRLLPEQARVSNEFRIGRLYSDVVHLTVAPAGE